MTFITSNARGTKPESANTIDQSGIEPDRRENTTITKFQESLVNVAVRITGDNDRARDIVQDVYLKYLESSEKFRNSSNLKTYLYRMVINRSIDLKRRRNRFAKIRELLFHERYAQPDNVYEVKDLVRRIFADIDQHFKVPFVLAEADGMSYEEIADVLQINISTVRTRIFRCRQRLRKKLSALGYPV
ncbi:MAG: RNA polymerase sigma factor [Chitinispirillaceae bacterium]|nr:RNA polymerase sigma factor [Chitinispirillaceae bacterium]